MLSSWKEIAQYVGSDEKTVREWAKKGLPVRHTAKGGVSISRAALNEWLLKRDDKVKAIEDVLAEIRELQQECETIAAEVDNLLNQIEEENRNHATDGDNEST
jgi:phage terminase Nu1 subunit (DNA packaging protein)